jgi:cell wall-associated NlpC family hydrolase
LPFSTIGAAMAPAQPVRLPFAAFLQRRVQAAFMAILMAVALVPVQAPATAEATHSEASRVVAHAKTHIGDRFVWGATGPSSFDCSGFVYHTFRETDLLSRIGGSRMTSSGYYSWFRSRGLTSRYNPRVGDLVVYGYSGRVSHIGIYIGDGKTISAISSGIRIHGTKSVTKPFIAYLHVRLSR